MFATVFQRKTFRRLFGHTNGKFRLQNVNGFEIIFILAILEFLFITVKQIKKKDDDREKDF